MNEEMVTYEERENTEMEVYNDHETSGGGILGKVLVGAGIVAAGAAALIYKNRDKLEARRIRKLEAKGYVITKPEVCEPEKNDSKVCEIPNKKQN